MRQRRSGFWRLLLVLLLLLGLLTACEAFPAQEAAFLQPEESAMAQVLDEAGSYYSKEDLTAYLLAYERLPWHYIKKAEAKKKGWDPQAGNLWEVLPEHAIGGDRFGNREGLLPKAKGRRYFECDVDYQGGYRGAKRLVYSDDGLIFYTADHYASFEAMHEQSKGAHP